MLGSSALLSGKYQQNEVNIVVVIMAQSVFYIPDMFGYIMNIYYRCHLKASDLILFTLALMNNLMSVCSGSWMDDDDGGQCGQAVF